MPPEMRAFLHKMQLADGPHSFAVATSFTQGQDNFEIRTNKGAVCKLRHTPTSLTMTGGDEQHRKFTLTLNTVGKQLSAALRVAGKTIRAKGAPREVMGLLSAEVKKTPAIQAAFPKSVAMGKLANRMRKDQKVVSTLIGIAKPAAKRKSYCEAICDCCSGGGTFTPWCCISCASCDFFEVDLADKFGSVVAPV